MLYDATTSFGAPRSSYLLKSRSPNSILSDSFSGGIAVAISLSIREMGDITKLSQRDFGEMFSESLSASVKLEPAVWVSRGLVNTLPQGAHLSKRKPRS